MCEVNQHELRQQLVLESACQQDVTAKVYKIWMESCRKASFNSKESLIDMSSVPCMQVSLPGNKIWLYSNILRAGFIWHFMAKADVKTIDKFLIYVRSNNINNDPGFELCHLYDILWVEGCNDRSADLNQTCFCFKNNL